MQKTGFTLHRFKNETTDLDKLWKLDIWPREKDLLRFELKKPVDYYKKQASSYLLAYWQEEGIVSFPLKLLRKSGSLLKADAFYSDARREAVSVAFLDSVLLAKLVKEIPDEWNQIVNDSLNLLENREDQLSFLKKYWEILMETSCITPLKKGPAFRLPMILTYMKAKLSETPMEDYVTNEKLEEWLVREAGKALENGIVEAVDGEQVLYNPEEFCYQYVEYLARG